MNRRQLCPNRLKRGLWLAALVALAPLSGAAMPQKAVGVFVEGQPAPALELPLASGPGTARLPDFEGRRVLLIQFASW